LKPETLSKLANRLPDTKIVLLVRDPVDRAWSHVCMWYRAGKFDKNLLRNASDFIAFLDEAGSFSRTSFPSKIVEAWKLDAPDMPFRHILFDDIRNEPERVRREFLEYVGADASAKSGELVAGHNKKANSEKLELPDTIRDALVAYFKDELQACAELFGSHARNWMLRYGV
jgi:hypothetical protein